MAAQGFSGLSLFTRYGHSNRPLMVKAAIPCRVSHSVIIRAPQKVFQH